ncbi:MAG: carboxylating nicotinate-nucleotide diphosphorylase [Pirellula sp.]|jgi:nicotinate-nucleotide pyrophosphorylase (carboxylating)|nr:carboxylating nicotinate-nucleotide diphosphorylase [Pirellula sp.]
MKASSAMKADYRSQTIDPPLLDDLSHLVRLAIREDLDRTADITTMAIVPQGVTGTALIVPRVTGKAAGIDLIEAMLQELDSSIQLESFVGDGETFAPKQPIASLYGDARDLLTCERTILNFLGRLCGIATLTSKYVEQVSGTKARVYDTRKTTPGWRRLEKYAVRCGGGRNHRLGLFDGILIKDNHLACRAAADGTLLDPGTAVETARKYIESGTYRFDHPLMIEIEIDSIAQLESALKASPNIILLDNMSNESLMQCVAMRDSVNPSVELEASGGVNLQTIAAIAKTGVDRISVGALTHSATNLDLGLDWMLGK